MKDTLIFVSVMAGWIVLNMWVLPYFGIRTCMSGGCPVPEVKQGAAETPPEPPIASDSPPSTTTSGPRLPQ